MLRSRTCASTVRCRSLGHCTMPSDFQSFSRAQLGGTSRPMKKWRWVKDCKLPIQKACACAVFVGGAHHAHLLSETWTGLFARSSVLTHAKSSSEATLVEDWQQDPERQRGRANSFFFGRLLEVYFLHCCSHSLCYQNCCSLLDSRFVGLLRLAPTSCKLSWDVFHRTRHLKVSQACGRIRAAEKRMSRSGTREMILLETWNCCRLL